MPFLILIRKRMLSNSSVSLKGKSSRAITASMKVLEKAGFHKCGIFRKSCFKNGKFVDCHCYELVDLKKIN